MKYNDLFQKYNRYLLKKRDLETVKMSEAILIPNNTEIKGCLDYFIELVYCSVSMIEFVIAFAYSGFISKNDFEDLKNKSLHETKFFDYLLNDFEVWCLTIYDTQKMFQENPMQKVFLYNHFKEWIRAIENVIGRDKLIEIFDEAFKKRFELRQTDFV